MFVELYEELKGVMFRNSAVPGQAAAIAIGLLMLGSFILSLTT